MTGEGPTLGVAPVHHVTIDDTRNGQKVEVEIPEDRCGVTHAQTATEVGLCDSRLVAAQKSGNRS